MIYVLAMGFYDNQIISWLYYAKNELICPNDWHQCIHVKSCTKYCNHCNVWSSHKSMYIQCMDGLMVISMDLIQYNLLQCITQCITKWPI